MFSAKVIEHSICPHLLRPGVPFAPRLLTLQLVYPRFVHSEFMTHRDFSRNAMSSRAVPVEKMIRQVRSNPAMPVHWGANQPGMQARAELEGQAKAEVVTAWLDAANAAANCAQRMVFAGAHKQVANRVLEPFQWMQTIMSATELDNWDSLRDHDDADPNIALLARLMKKARAESVPVELLPHSHNAMGWHLPYITAQERATYHDQPRFLAQVSAARCARVSYLTHDGQLPDIRKDLALYDRLVGSVPMHASPVEHQAYAASSAFERSGNFVGFIRHRKLVEADMQQRLAA